MSTPSLPFAGACLVTVSSFDPLPFVAAPSLFLFLFFPVPSGGVDTRSFR